MILWPQRIKRLNVHVWCPFARTVITSLFKFVHFKITVTNFLVADWGERYVVQYGVIQYHDVGNDRLRTVEYIDPLLHFGASCAVSHDPPCW